MDDKLPNATGSNAESRVNISPLDTEKSIAVPAGCC